jgi:hypothetical protein
MGFSIFVKKLSNASSSISDIRGLQQLGTLLTSPDIFALISKTDDQRIKGRGINSSTTIFLRSQEDFLVGRW